MKKRLIPLAIVFTICGSLPLFAMELSVQSQKEKIETYMTEGANLDNYDHNGNTPLFFAAQHNDINLVHKLVASGAGVNTQALNGSTPLSEAVRHRNINIVSFLLDHGAQSGIQDEKGDTALSLALDNGFIDIAQRIVSGENKSKAKKNRTVKNEAEKNQGEKEHKKSKKEQIKNATHLVVYEIKAGFDFKHIQEHRNVSEHVQRRALDVFKKEYQSTINVERRAQIDNAWPLLKAAMLNNDSKAVKCLVNDPTIDINMQDIFSCTPLVLAASKGNLKIVKALVNHKKIVIDVPNVVGRTPLMEAVFYEHFEVAKLLIKKGANINAHDALGFTPLRIAISKKNHAMVDLLLSFYSELDINMKSINGYSALYHAARDGQFDLVEKLVQYGAIIEDESEETSPLNCIEISQKIEKYLRKVVRKRAHEIAGEHYEQIQEKNQSMETHLVIDRITNDRYDIQNITAKDISKIIEGFFGLGIVACKILSNEASKHNNSENSFALQMQQIMEKNPKAYAFFMENPNGAACFVQWMYYQTILDLIRNKNNKKEGAKGFVDRCIVACKTSFNAPFQRSNSENNSALQMKQMMEKHPVATALYMKPIYHKMILDLIRNMNDKKEEMSKIIKGFVGLGIVACKVSFNEASQRNNSENNFAL